MELIDNFICKCYSQKENACTILTVMDIHEFWDEEQVKRYMKLLCSKNQILLKKFSIINDILLSTNVSTFKVSDYYKIQYIPFTKFDETTTTLLNDTFTTEMRWGITFCIDKDANKTRLYFKSDHLYADGYQIIKILSLSQKEEQIVEKFKRTTTIVDTLYYYVFGTLLLIIVNLKFCIKLFYTSHPIYSPNNTLFLKTKPFDLATIKVFTRAHNITINDFLYSLMIKTDYLYRKQDKTIFSISPINISQLRDTNNMAPLYINVRNNLDSLTLLQTVHTIFNSCKYSLFIPMLSITLTLLSNSIPLSLLKLVASIALNSSDYIYTNIIGPNKSSGMFPPNDVYFLTTTKNNTIGYNIISYEGKLNIIITFKEGVIKDKKRFEECIYEAYKDLTNVRSIQTLPPPAPSS